MQKRNRTNKICWAVNGSLTAEQKPEASFPSLGKFKDFHIANGPGNGEYQDNCDHSKPKFRLWLNLQQPMVRGYQEWEIQYTKTKSIVTSHHCYLYPDSCVQCQGFLNVYYRVLKYPDNQNTTGTSNIPQILRKDQVLPQLDYHS